MWMIEGKINRAIKTKRDNIDKKLVKWVTMMWMMTCYASNTGSKFKINTILGVFRDECQGD